MGSKAEGLALMMFFFASCTKEVASRVLQQLVHKQFLQKTPADQQHIQANISAVPDVCIIAVSHTGHAVRRFWWLNVRLHCHNATQSQLYTFSHFCLLPSKACISVCVSDIDFQLHDKANKCLRMPTKKAFPSSAHFEWLHSAHLTYSTEFH